MKLLTKSNDPNASLGIIERTAYMSGNIGIALVNTIISSFVMFYYTDVMMLNPGVIGMIMLASRIFDGVTDLVMGAIVDRTHSRHGKSRVWILRMCIPYAISGILMCSVPGNAVETLQYIYVFITYNLCNAVCLTAIYVPYNAMTCNITSNQYERGLLGVFVMFGATFGTMLVQSTIDAATKALGGGPRAWRIVVAVYAVCGVLLHLFCFFFTKERCGVTEDSAEKKENIPLKQELKALFTNQYWIISVVSIFLVMFFTYFSGNAGVYYAKGVLGDTGYYASFANVMSIAQMLTLFVVFIPMKKLGKRNTMILGLSMMTAGCFIQGIIGDSLTVTQVCGALKGIGGGLSGGAMYGLIADTIDYGEWKSGLKTDGIGMAAVTFVTKIAGGFTGVIIGWMLKVGQYDAEAAVQSAKAVMSLKLLFIWLPCIFCGVGTLLLCFYKLDKIYPEIQKDLAERRQKK